MDSTSIITQASREEEQLTSFPPERALTSVKKPRHKGLINSLLCCFGAKSKRPNPPIHTEGSSDGSRRNKGLLNSLPCCFGKKSKQPNPPIHAEEVSDESEKNKIFFPQDKHLLPQVKHQDAHKMCLVIDLDETLVHSSFKPISNADFIVPVEIDGVIHQVYVLKRPYVDEFLQKMGEMFECVLFTASLAKYADPVADLLDKWGVFRSRLFRESCVFYRGNYVKDLGRLGRDLRKVIIVDNSPASYIFHPDNAVPVNSWFDDMSDTELRDLIPFFEQLSKMDDVYSVLRNSNHAAGSHPHPNPTINGSHFITQHVNGLMQPS